MSYSYLGKRELYKRVKNLIDRELYPIKSFAYKKDYEFEFMECGSMIISSLFDGNRLCVQENSHDESDKCIFRTDVYVNFENGKYKEHYVYRQEAKCK